jgi:hypothetical protein
MQNALLKFSHALICVFYNKAFISDRRIDRMSFPQILPNRILHIFLVDAFFHQANIFAGGT